MIYFGLLLILFGWILQYVSSGQHIEKKFVFLYIVGAVLLTLDAALSRLPLLALLHFGIGIVVLMIFRKMRGRRSRR